ncbi:MAG: SDR family NAD(P)-dependent oxidoreductase [Acidiferrobacterales bacterium]
MDVKGCAAIVTGGGSGMGAETGRFLAAAGAKVALLDVNLDGAKQAAGEIGGLALECNVADAASAQAAIAKARETHGPARICINCAGIAPAKRIVGRDGPMPLEDFTRVIDVNLVGTFNIMRLAAADMQTLDPVTESDERGVIICTASIAAFEGQIGQAAYSASKGGVVSLTLQAAREFASNGIRVVTIVPGLIATPMLLSMPKEVQESLAQQPPFPKRFGRPDEYAKLAMHIIDNEMINGDCIRLDGAIRMQPK